MQVFNKILSNSIHTLVRFNYQTIVRKREASFFLFIAREIGPFIYFDIIFIFLLILSPAFPLNCSHLISKVYALVLVRTIQSLQMSPRILYRYLNPLYSIRGGSTIRAEPLINKPKWVAFLKEPLYKWNVRTHRTFVLSVKKSHVCFCTTNTEKRSQLKLLPQVMSVKYKSYNIFHLCNFFYSVFYIPKTQPNNSISRKKSVYIDIYR